MQDRGIDIITIGLVYASLPIIFQLTRMLFGVLSDFIGRKVFFVSNGFLKFLTLVIYYFAYTPYHFLFGKITEGIKSASNWAVNRAYAMETSKDKRKALTKLRAINSISSALGRLLAGFLIIYLFYPNTLLLCIFLSLLIIPNALKIKEKTKKRRIEVKKILKIFNVKKRKKKFKRSLIIFLLRGLSYGLITGYVFPLFLESNGFTPEIIGLLLSIQTLFAGITTYFLSKRTEVKLSKLILHVGISYFSILLLLAFSNSILAGILIILLGLAEGGVFAVHEGILSKVSSEDSYAGDIGLIFMGFHSARSVSLMLSGFLIASYGFSAPMILSASIFLVYLILTYQTFKEK